MADDQADLLISAFDLIAERGWAGFSLVELGRRTETPLVELYRTFPSRGGVLRALSRRIDEAMLSFDEAELAGLPPRDTVFELIMRRFEALVPYRSGLERLAREGRCDPCLVLATCCRLDRSFRWLQAAAGLRSHGLRARVHRRALMAAYLQTMPVWFKDDSADLGKTMAELDKRLRRVAAVAGLRERRRPEAAPPAAEAPQPA